MNRITMNTAKQELMAGLAWGGVMLALAFGASFARKLGYIDGDSVTRVVVGINGLWIAWYGNRMPKLIVPNSCARQIRRVGGWAMVLSGLVYAGLFAVAPIPVAARFGGGAVLAGFAVTLGYCLSLRAKAKAT
jgi:hypothetical protein